jgi:hypothetical protein
LHKDGYTAGVIVFSPMTPNNAFLRKVTSADVHPNYATKVQEKAHVHIMISSGDKNWVLVAVPHIRATSPETTGFLDKNQPWVPVWISCNSTASTLISSIDTNNLKYVNRVWSVEKVGRKDFRFAMTKTQKEIDSEVPENSQFLYKNDDTWKTDGKNFGSKEGQPYYAFLEVGTPTMEKNDLFSLKPSCLNIDSCIG